MKTTQKIGGQNDEMYHGTILEVPLSTIRPSPLNDKLYRPVNPDDPEIIALAKSIAKFGLREPIVISLDDYIISGHRRFAACRLAGLTEARCRRESIRSTDPKFGVFLREHNRQRVKSADEVVREEVASANPKEAYRLLQEHRRKAARVDADTITITGTTRRAAITEAKTPFLDVILGVLEDRRDFWPLTDRMVHYALLNRPPLVHAGKSDSHYANTQKCYKATCELITRARLAGRIPWAAIHDPTRNVVIWSVYREPTAFIRESMDDLLKGYYRDLQQSQPNQIEIVGEKNTIESVIRPISMEYCIPLTIGRGYCSLPPRYKMAERFRRSGKSRLILLVLSDLDPEGEDIAHSFARSMRDDFGIVSIDPIKVALKKKHVEEMQLPPQMKAKQGSSRRKRFVEQHGDDVYELESVPPERLQALLRAAIDEVLDVDAYNNEIDAEEQDAAHLHATRAALLASMETR